MQDIYKNVSQAYPDQFLHVVQPHGFFVSDDGMKTFIVMEFLAGGDLRKYLNWMLNQGEKINIAVCIIDISS
ncbi:MAG: hypothetical protein EZS28_041334 [Streblomastix strix]|uniref:Protein kinase domain-containing protein n=1 Tax=Streblomastix strix TaxID=222440 RepID=A0A5J4TYX1_9EUKA|nr:MAG: hypothetical protein EZS28_041334 [Streblomastix strix]